MTRGGDAGHAFGVACSTARHVLIPDHGEFDAERADSGLFPVASYYEVTTEQYERLNDEEWEQQVIATPAPPEPEWMKPLAP